MAYNPTATWTNWIEQSAQRKANEHKRREAEMAKWRADYEARERKDREARERGEAPQDDGPMAGLAGLFG